MLNMNEWKASCIAKYKQWNYGYQFHHHYTKYLLLQIKVVENDPIAPADSRYMATFGDYDLDCKVGLGATPEEASENLCIDADIDYFIVT